MEKLRFSFVLLLLFAFLCTANSNPITSLFGKSSDDKAEADEKIDEKAAVTTTTAKAAGETTTTTTTTTATPEPSSSCGGLKGFLHICDKAEPTEPTKNVKTRSVPEEDDSDEGSDSDEESEKKEGEQETESPGENEQMETVAKRQVGDPEAPVLGEIPPVLGDAMAPPVEPSEGDAEDDGKMEKRQTEDSDSNSDSDEDKTEEVIDGSRRRRDCRDGDGEYTKDCRKKRELVPTCTHKNCKSESLKETKIKEKLEHQDVLTTTARLLARVSAMLNGKAI